MNTELLKSKLLEAAFNGSLTHADTSKWKYTTIGEAMINLDSQRIPLSVAVRQKLEKNYDYYGASGVIDKVDKYLFDRPLLLIGEDGANLLSRSTPIAFIAKGKYWVNNHAHVLDTGDNIFLEFICYYINSISLVPYVTGVAQPKLNQENLNRIPIHLPPLTEQQQIISALEEGFASIDAIAEAKENLSSTAEMLRSKILQAAFDGSLTGSDVCTWEYTTMGQVFDHNTGKALKKSNTEGVLKPYITTSNVYWNRFELDAVKEMYFKTKELAKYTITKGDLLICEGGDVGRSAIWNLDYDICFQNHIHRLRPKNEAIVKFYYYIMLFYKRTNRIHGTGIGLEGFSSGVLDKLEVPYPPLAEQKRIVAKIEELFAEIDKLTK